MVGDLLETAVTAKFAIQQVQQLEMELQAQHPHLTMPCWVLPTLVMPEITSNIHDILTKHAGRDCKWENQDIISFLGDCMECFFISPSSEWNKWNTIIQDFCSHYGVNLYGQTRTCCYPQGSAKVWAKNISQGHSNHFCKNRAALSSITYIAASKQLYRRGSCNSSYHPTSLWFCWSVLWDPLHI